MNVIQVGLIVGNYMTGVLLDVYDWPIVFYVFGIIGFIVTSLFVSNEIISSFIMLYGGNINVIQMI